MRILYRQAVGALLATSVAVTSATVLAGPADAIGKPARIRGVVTTPEGTGLAGIRVAALAEMTVGGIEQWVEVDTAVTGVDGRYSVGKLDDGTYRVRFDDPSGSYATEFYNNAPRADEAEDVFLLPGGGMRDLLPTELGGAAHLTGLVTGSTGAGIGGAEVTAYVVDDSGAWIPFVTVEAGADGRYDVGGLPGGVYTLGFHDPATQVGEYWNDEVAIADADTLMVDSAGSTTGLDARLATPLPEPTPTDPTPTTTVDPATTTTPVAATSATPVQTAAPTATAKQVVMVKRPRIRGIAAVTEVLRVTRGSWNPTKISRKIQWLANGKRIKGATKARLRVSKKLVGKRISVRVIASAPEHTRLLVKTRRTKRVRA